MNIQKIVMGVMILGLMTSGIALAKPERLQIKDPNKKVKEQAAKSHIKNIDLRKIEDPEARKAIREIFNYFNLQSK